MSRWTKLHFEEVARILYEARVNRHQDVDWLVQEFAGVFAEENPLFNEQKFRLAVYGGD